MPVSLPISARAMTVYLTREQASPARRLTLSSSSVPFASSSVTTAVSLSVSGRTELRTASYTMSACAAPQPATYRQHRVTCTICTVAIACSASKALFALQLSAVG